MTMNLLEFEIYSRGEGYGIRIAIPKLVKLQEAKEWLDNANALIPLPARVQELEAELAPNGADLRVVRAAYGWTINENYELDGLTAGDMGYEPSGLQLDSPTIEWLKKLEATAAHVQELEADVAAKDHAGRALGLRVRQLEHALNDCEIHADVKGIAEQTACAVCFTEALARVRELTAGRTTADSWARLYQGVEDRATELWREAGFAGDWEDYPLEVAERLLAKVQELERELVECRRNRIGDSEIIGKHLCRVKDLERNVTNLEHGYEDQIRLYNEMRADRDRLKREVTLLTERDVFLTTEIQKLGSLALDLMVARADIDRLLKVGGCATVDELINKLETSS